MISSWVWQGGNSIKSNTSQLCQLEYIDRFSKVLISQILDLINLDWELGISIFSKTTTSVHLFSNHCLP